MDVAYDEGKLTELLLYVAERLGGDRAGGATKVNKVLFFADFAHVRRTGAPITGAAYQKLPQGPAPRRLKPVRDALVAHGEAELRREQFLGYELHRLVPTRPADTAIFSADELATIDQVLADLDGLNAQQVSDLSHQEAGWRLVDDGEVNPLRSGTRRRAPGIHADHPTARARDRRARRPVDGVIREVHVDFADDPDYWDTIADDPT